MEENNEKKEVEVNNVEQKTNEVEGTKGIGIAAMVLGIVAIVLFCIPWLSVPCAVIAIILGIIGIVKKAGKGMAIAGLVLGILPLLIWALGIFGIVSFVANVDNNAINDVLNSGEFRNAMSELNEIR